MARAFLRLAASLCLANLGSGAVATCSATYPEVASSTPTPAQPGAAGRSRRSTGTPARLHAGGIICSRKADEASERHESTSDGDQRGQTTGQRVVGAGRVGGKHTQTPTTAADRQPDGKKGRLRIDLGPSLADASQGGASGDRGETTSTRRVRRGKRGPASSSTMGLGAEVTLT